MTSVTAELSVSTPAESVRRALKESEFLKSLVAARNATPQSRGMRALRPDEIEALKRSTTPRKTGRACGFPPNSIRTK